VTTKGAFEGFDGAPRSGAGAKFVFLAH
jgi:hypothetical protein